MLCNRLKINIMLLMKIYLIYKFSILVLGSILIIMANNVVSVKMCLRGQGGTLGSDHGK